MSVVSPSLPELMTEEGAFSVIPVYLRLIAAGHAVRWWDVGDALSLRDPFAGVPPWRDR